MPAKLRPSVAERGYGARHQATRRGLEPFVLAGGVDCARCGEPIVPGEEWHLGHTDDRTGYTGPEHARCNVRAASEKAARMRWNPPPPPEPEPEPVGVAADDERWRVPWLLELVEVPSDATWPRYMSLPPASAAGSLGAEFVAWSEQRESGRLRWWQRLVATRLLEVDADGRLVWETLLLTMARQLGKSWLLRELILWRIHQADRFGEPQDVLHTGKDLRVVKEVMRPAMFWANGRPGYQVRYANGEQQIEWNRSRWMLLSKTSPYGSSVSVAAVDEAWKVKPELIDEGFVPTMVERQQPQLWLISTAHREASALMLARRKVALDNLEVGNADLLIEWSAPRDAQLDDVAGWRSASPHWTAQRERLVGRQLEMARTGEAEVVEDEADPVEAFRAQWLNQWPDRAITVTNGEPLLPAGLWAWLAEPDEREQGPLYIALEDNFGNGAAVAVVAEVSDGRLEVDGWLRPDWDSAVRDVEQLAATREVRGLQVGASLLDRVPDDLWPRPAPAGSIETKVGLAVLRDLAAAGRIVHDPASERTAELDSAIGHAQVRELQTGLTLAPGGAAYLVKALAWAVASAHARVPEAAIY